ncbi:MULTISPECIES: LPS assembly lipoprotein LptE [Chelativorans]|uniref:LPS-assembly lipoprotein n=1 Tax=Chelativorans sp. (strain BNC1) TaxID=266779 RepID=Q11DE3_CHESB
MRLTIRAFPVAAAALMLLMAGGCTVQPLLSTQQDVSGQQTLADLSAVSVDPVDTRQALEVRNHLLFLLHGSARPTAERYKLNFSVSSAVTSAATVQIANQNEPTAGTVSLSATYRLSDAGTGKTLAQGTRQVMSAFDRSRQEFAVLRAVRDAEDRAARELAELLRMAIAQDMVRLNLR